MLARYWTWTSGPAAAAESGLPFGPLRFRAWTSSDDVVEPPVVDLPAVGFSPLPRVKFPRLFDVRFTEPQDSAIGNLRRLAAARALARESQDGLVAAAVSIVRGRAVATEVSDSAVGSARTALRARGVAREFSDRVVVTNRAAVRARATASEGKDSIKAKAVASWDAAVVESIDVLLKGKP
jgi:hypothetical protein